MKKRIFIGSVALLLLTIVNVQYAVNGYSISSRFSDLFAGQNIIASEWTATGYMPGTDELELAECVYRGYVSDWYLDENYSWVYETYGFIYIFGDCVIPTAWGQYTYLSDFSSTNCVPGGQWHCETVLCPPISFQDYE